MNLIITTFSLFVPAVLGYFFLEGLIGEKLKFKSFERISLGFGIGFGFLTQEMFYLSLLKIPFAIPMFITPLILSVLFLCFRKKRLLAVGTPSFSWKMAFAKMDPLGLWGSLLLYLIIFVCITVFIRTFLIEIDMWDSWAVWAYKAKIYFVHQIIPFDKYKAFVMTWGCWDYPHHVPLMETWVLLFFGFWNDQWPRLIFPTFFVGLAANSYFYFRRHVDRNTALACVFMIVSLPTLEVITMFTIAEVVLLYYYLSSVYFLLRWIEERNSLDYILSAILIGLAGWTKNEGSVYFLINLFIIILCLKKGPQDILISFSRAIQYFVIFFLIAGPWWIIKSAWGLKNWIINSKFLVTSNIISNMYDFPKVFKVMGSAVNASLTIWIMFLVFFIISWRRTTFVQRCVLLMIACHLFIILCLFCINSQEILSFINLLRLLIAPSLLTFVYVILVIGRPSVVGGRRFFI